MRSFSFLILYWMISSTPVMAQRYRAGLTFNDRYFLLEVKQIDEFIERFNDDRNSFLRNNIRKYYPRMVITRPLLLKTLFDSKSNQISSKDIENFVAAVNNSRHPEFLYFNKGTWYAEAICRLRYKEKDIEASALLKVVGAAGASSKWMICAVHSKAIEKYNGSISVPVSGDTNRFLSPMCHATNFICLGNAFGDLANIRDYLDKSFTGDPESISFLHALMKREITFQYVETVRYHFLQIREWAFIVENFNRKDSYNSGWLISSLKQCSRDDPKTINTLF